MDDSETNTTPVEMLPAFPEKRKGRKARIIRSTHVRGHDPNPATLIRRGGADAYDPAVLERQGRCYDLRVRGYTMAAIADAIGIDRDTVTRDVMLEAQRRVAERGSDRPTLAEQAAARFESSFARIGARIAKLESLVAEELRKDKPNTRREIALRMIIATEEKTSVAAIKGSMEALGVTTPIKVDVNHTHHLEGMQAALDIAKTMSTEARAELFRRGRAAAEERMRNVTPQR